MDFQLNEQQRQFAEMARGLYEKKLKPMCEDHSPEGERKIRKVLAEHGLLGLNMPVEYGGQGLPLLDTLVIMQNMNYCDSMLGPIVHRSTSGAVNTISVLGTEDQKRRFIPPVVRGESAFSIGITESEAGSAATDLVTRAHIEGSKQFISHTLYTDHTIVYCQFGEGRRASEIGAVIVPHNTPGFVKSKGGLNMADELQVELFFDNMRLQRSNIVMEGNAFGRLINVYNAERLGGIARMLGSAQASFDYAVEYSKTRRQFNQDICEFQGIQWMIADMKVKLDAAELLLYRAASNAQAGLPSPFETSMAKVYCGQALKEVCDDAIQILGGYGYQKAYPVEKRYREVRGGSIYSGTSQIHKNMIAAQVLGRKFSQRKKS
jgi:alkylation response protein AidB-like acyl-CoA dehydrogenase